MPTVLFGKHWKCFKLGTHCVESQLYSMQSLSVCVLVCVLVLGTKVLLLPANRGHFCSACLRLLLDSGLGRWLGPFSFACERQEYEHVTSPGENGSPTQRMKKLLFHFSLPKSHSRSWFGVVGTCEVVWSAQLLFQLWSVLGKTKKQTCRKTCFVTTPTGLLLFQHCLC